MATETRQPTFEQLQQGIIKAHNAGDTAAAQRMAEILNLSPSTIQAIHMNKTWKHLPR